MSSYRPRRHRLELFMAASSDAFAEQDPGEVTPENPVIDPNA